MGKAREGKGRQGKARHGTGRGKGTAFVCSSQGRKAAPRTWGILVLAVQTGHAERPVVKEKLLEIYFQNQREAFINPSFRRYNKLQEESRSGGTEGG